MEPEKLTPSDLPMAPEPKGPEIKIETGIGLPPTPPEGQPEFFSPETIAPSPIPEGVEARRGNLRTFLIILGAAAFVGVVGSLSYFVIFPLIFQPKAPETIQRPEIIDGRVAAHKSFLVNPPAAEADLKLAGVDYLTIAAALQNESFNQLADGQLKEVKISDNKGQVPFASYLGALMPAATALGGTDWFENDFTALLYYDANGVWPIYIAKLKSGVDSSAVKNGLKALEPIMETANLYLNPPGTFAPFKDGKAGNYPTRYSVGTQKGAAFNYGIAGNYLILSANYNGLKSVLPLLGL